VVLINQLPEQEVEDVLSHFPKMTIRFVRGDFTRENILLRANAQEARAAIMVPDDSTPAGKTGDERTILATLSLKTVNPKIKVYAHILDRDNLSHLRKARVDDVIVSDAYTGYLLAHYVTSPGIPQFIEQLFSAGSAFGIRRREIPESLIGSSYESLQKYYNKHYQGILLGLGRVSESFNLSELLSSDSSYLDAFIMRKFQEAGRGVKSDEQIKIMLNPAADYTLTPANFYFAIEGGDT
jgi:voltage-gated potassium channel